MTTPITIGGHSKKPSPSPSQSVLTKHMPFIPTTRMSIKRCGFYVICNRKKHEKNHTPFLHGSSVLKKINGNQKYGTTAITAGVLRDIASRVDVPLQVNNAHIYQEPCIKERNM